MEIKTVSHLIEIGSVTPLYDRCWNIGTTSVDPRFVFSDLKEHSTQSTG